MIPGGNFAVWLYGSHSRGDSDDFSDMDVLFVSEDGRIVEVDGYLMEQRKDLSISNYSWSEIGNMAQYGSLFLRHIQLEGRPILEGQLAKGRLEKILSSLGSYQRVSRDLSSFRTVLDDIYMSVNDGEASLYFELSTLATVIRHTSILGCSLARDPCFSRNDPIGRVTAHWKLPREWADEFPDLYTYRLYAVRRAPRPREATTQYVLMWCERLNQILTLFEHYATKKS